MLFNSWTFLLFFLSVIPLYFLIPKKFQNIFLVIISYIFYGSWDPRFLSLIIFSTFVDYFLALKIHNHSDDKKRKLYLQISLLINLGMLGIFKYFNFFIDNAITLMHSIGMSEASTYSLNIILPVGISFYTFQTLSYTIDVYKKQIKPITAYLDYSLYVAYFPQLVAGPIERASQLIPQLIKSRSFSKDQFLSGLWLILWGFFKKVVIADNLAMVVNQVFNADVNESGINSLLAIYAFAFQIYCDFSGYSDIARGLSKLLGIELMKNFNIPYISKNPQEFWHRWHISLSTWLKDYLYIPLGGNKNGEIMTYRNLILTMVLGGLWHGAAWTYIVWGIFHGALLAIHRYFFAHRSKKSNSIISNKLKQFGMFHLVCFGWLLFRASSMTQVVSFLNNIVLKFNLINMDIQLAYKVSLFVFLLWFFELIIKNVDDPRKIKYWNFGLGPFIITALFILIILLPPPAGSSFIYFQF